MRAAIPRGRREFIVGALALSAALALFSGCAVPKPKENLTGYVDDATISSKIKSRLVDDKELDASGISVETANGIVVLSGFTSSTLERNNAENIAIGTRGTKLVKNEIAIRRP